jgi:hypothetical protein
MLKSRVWVALLIGLLSATTSQAGSVAYYLDQSDRLADGVNYLLVTISDDGKDGAIDFKVEALQPLIDLAGTNFGIQMFGFNVVGGTGAEARHVSSLPDKWRAQNGGRMDGFGFFDITMQTRSRGHDDSEKTNGKGHEEHGNGKGLGHDGGLNPQQPLTFSITGVKLDDLLSYVDLSTGYASEGFSLFSARVTGLVPGDCGGDKDGYGGQCDVTSAYFGGTTAVPAPPAVWLLGTGIVGLVLRRFRGARAAATA